MSKTITTTTLKPKPPNNGFKEESSDSDDTDWKTVITNAIDADKANLLSFLDTFDSAVRNGNIDHMATVTTTPAAKTVSEYLSSHGIKSMTISPPLQQPSVVSVFDEGEGPCMVLNGILSIIPPTQNPTTKNEVPSNTAGTAAVVAAYAYLHSLRNHLNGTVVLETISDIEGGARHLLHVDERRTLWRGDCMLSCSSSVGGLTASCVMHPLAAALSNNGYRVTGRRPSNSAPQGICKIWNEAGVPSYSYCLGAGEKVRREEFLELVKVVALSAWDYLGVDE